MRLFKLAQVLKTGRAVNNRALAEEQASVSKLLLEQIKDLFVQAVFLKEMTEAQNRSLIGTFSRFQYQNDKAEALSPRQF